MADPSVPIAGDIQAYLKAQEEKSLLRFITCGSVDDGKSTLIGRLLWDSQLIFEDQLAALEADSKKSGTQGGRIDYALLLDGLQAEREQGITIDVAYRFFSTEKRKFIVADTPGHEQYTRNMVTGASTAGVAVILVDARKGVLTQTKRHSYLVSLVGIRKIVLAINKMDLVGFSRQRYEQIREEYEFFVAGLGFSQITSIPLSALEGDNVLARSPRTSWYAGPTLLEHLEAVEVVEEAGLKPFRLPVQWVNRPNLDFRGFCGTIASGRIRPGDEVVVTGSGQKSRVKRIVTFDGDLEEAAAGQAVTLTLADEIDISRGDVLADPQARPYHADQFEAKLAWLHEEPLQTGSSYLLKAGTCIALAQVGEVRFRINVNRLEQEDGGALVLNEVGVVRIALAKAISFDSYRENSATGSFILIDRLSNATVGAGMIHQPLRQAQGTWQGIELNRMTRAERLGQTPAVYWLTGPDPGRLDEVAELMAKKLLSLGRHSYVLRPDIFRSEGTGHQPLEHLGKAANILSDAGLIVIVPLAASRRCDRRFAQRQTDPDISMEILVMPKPRLAHPGSYQPPREPRLKSDSSTDPGEQAERLVRDLYG